MREGKGKMLYEPQVVDGEQKQVCMYRGFWKADKKDGKGLFRLPDGT